MGFYFRPVFDEHGTFFKDFPIERFKCYQKGTGKKRTSMILCFYREKGEKRKKEKGDVYDFREKGDGEKGGKREKGDVYDFMLLSVRG